MTTEIQPLFSNPVAIITPDTIEPFYEALDFCSTLEYNLNTGQNLASIDTDILSHPKFKEIRDIIQTQINHYAHDLMKWENIELYITQSWINVNHKGTKHHSHFHPNSVISGTFYLQTVPDDTISFHNDRMPIAYEFEKSEYNIWNSNTWTINVTTNSIVLFPSSLFHSVNSHDEDISRVSIAFNVFFRGQAGNKTSLTYLNI